MSKLGQEAFSVREVTPEERTRIENNFTYHPPHGDQVNKYATMRNIFKHMAMNLCRMCPQSWELSLALTKLEEAVFWANAAIARNEQVTDE